MSAVASTLTPLKTTSPLRSVLAAMQDGAATTSEIRTRTGLDAGVVQAALAHLERTGHLGSQSLVIGCDGVCSACPALAGGCASKQHGADTGRAKSRPGGRPLLALWVRRS
jgi:hypothetical protein